MVSGHSLHIAKAYWTSNVARETDEIMIPLFEKDTDGSPMKRKVSLVVIYLEATAEKWIAARPAAEKLRLG